ncbi:MoaD/ThiS family protein [Acaricomes phytoseiuli]|uniref:MoaD/ThiS family protein n=1 Tax=Acaricomes phytoseiuli TaxID=291968 RepID=UPI0003773298|nr:MoaD/ThiS family protein [Acaricomes phytoseiuli]MCW1248791.1 MoaD/ThiS family protein [Acaricomes phytoseiuli]
MKVRYFAAARAATGVDEEVLESFAGNLGELIAELTTRYPESASASAPPLSELLPRCSFLHNSTALRDDGTSMSLGDTVDVLPPFAGG